MGEAIDGPVCAHCGKPIFKAIFWRHVRSGTRFCGSTRHTAAPAKEASLG